MDAVFPFHIHFHRDLTIINAGTSALKLQPDLVGRTFEETFRLQRPAFSQSDSYESLLELKDQLFILEFRNRKPPLLMRGQVLPLEAEQELIFIGSPWLKNIDDFQTYGLLVN
ncbi:MAG: hypothetical protein AAGB22_04735, partial [Bacteroidota bacterium]